MYYIFGNCSESGVKLDNCYSYDDSNHELDVSFYGEIYNSHSIQEKLSKSGLSFGSDNIHELLAKSYIEWGYGCNLEFNGAFSYCIHDKNKKIIFMSRDQVGKKNLYYSLYNHSLIISSEVNKIIQTKGFPREVDLRSLNYFIANRSVPADLCIFNHVHKLPPGCFAVYDIESGNIRINNYWKPPQSVKVDGRNGLLIHELEDLILESLKIRIGDSSTTGAFLSGGLDSSLLVAMMSRVSENPVKTFCVSFDLNKYNEFPYSDLVAKHCNTDHKEFFVESDFTVFTKVASLFDEPLGDPSIYPTYYAYKIASDEVENVISGDGADSLFLGNRSHYLTIRYSNIKNCMVFPINSISDKLANLLPEETKWRIFLEDITPEEFYSRRGTVFTTGLRKKLLTDWINEELKEDINEPDFNKISDMELYEFMTKSAFRAHQNSTIFKVERLSNNFTLNVRTPFLDTRVVEYGFSKIPGDLKIKGVTTKYILKEIAKKYLPKDFPINRKQGLNPPFSELIRNEWNNQVKDILLSGEETYFRKEYIESLLETHKNPLFDQGRKLFNLLAFKIWEMKYLHGESL